MLISHKKKFIYLKTKKTASTSVEIYFEPECVSPNLYFGPQHSRDEAISEFGIVGKRLDGIGSTWVNHMTAQDVKSKIGDEIWNKYFKFCVIRNPFDKLVSYWWWKLGIKDSQKLNEMEFSEIKKHFNLFVKKIPSLVLDRDIYMINNEPCIDYFIRYENLASDISQVCTLLEINFDSSRIGKYKSSFRKAKVDFHDYYDDESKNIVQQAYAWEIAKFNYNFD